VVEWGKVDEVMPRFCIKELDMGKKSDKGLSFDKYKRGVEELKTFEREQVKEGRRARSEKKVGGRRVFGGAMMFLGAGVVSVGTLVIMSVVIMRGGSDAPRVEERAEEVEVVESDSDEESRDEWEEEVVVVADVVRVVPIIDRGDGGGGNSILDEVETPDTGGEVIDDGEEEGGEDSVVEDFIDCGMKKLKVSCEVR
jgi:hypothetical protein